VFLTSHYALLVLRFFFGGLPVAKDNPVDFWQIRAALPALAPLPFTFRKHLSTLVPFGMVCPQ